MDNPSTNEMFIGLSLDAGTDIRGGLTTLRGLVCTKCGAALFASNHWTEKGALSLAEVRQIHVNWHEHTPVSG